MFSGGKMETKICKKCEVARYHQYKGLAKSGNKLYVDEEGKFWLNGGICPQCKSEYQRQYNRNKKTKSV